MTGRPSWRTGPALLLLSALLAADLAAAGLAVGGQLLAALSMHLAASGACGWHAWTKPGRPTAAAACVRTAAMLAPSLGPLASLCGLVMVLAAARGEAAPDARAWYEHLFPDTSGDPLSARADRAAPTRPDTPGEDVASFHDVLQWGTLAEREHMLTLIGRSFRPDFAPVLRRALSGGDPGLRAQAAAGLSLLEARMSTRIAPLREAYERSAGAARQPATLALAQALSEAAHSGLYDGDRSRELREEVVTLLSPAFAAEGGGAVGAVLGRTLIQLGALPAATQVLDAAAGAAEGDAALPWLVEALYGSREFARLTDLLQSRRPQVDAIVAEDGPLAPALAFWTEAA